MAHVFEATIPETVSFFYVKHFTYIETHCRLRYVQQHQLTKKNKFKTYAIVVVL